MIPMVSQSFSTSDMMCVEKMTVLPLLRHSWMKAVMVRAVMTSRPLVGSSKIMTGGSWTRVRAMEVFCFMPVESLSQRRSRKPFISRRLKMLSTRFLSWKRLDRPRASIIEGPLTELVRQGKTAFRVYYAGGGEMLRAREREFSPCHRWGIAWHQTSQE